MRLPPSLLVVADPYKLQQQIVRFGASIGGMPPIWVYEGSDGVLEIVHGVTRATAPRSLPLVARFLSR